MSTIDDVYRKFGEAAEAAQLLETELANDVFLVAALDAGLLEIENPQNAEALLRQIDRSTLGQLIRRHPLSAGDPDRLTELLAVALVERNRLAHSFYRQHNFRRNSNEGCTIMLADLEQIHSKILAAYLALLKLSGFDPTAHDEAQLPTRHLDL